VEAKADVKLLDQYSWFMSMKSRSSFVLKGALTIETTNSWSCCWLWVSLSRNSFLLKKTTSSLAFQGSSHSHVSTLATFCAGSYLQIIRKNACYFEIWKPRAILLARFFLYLNTCSFLVMNLLLTFKCLSWFKMSLFYRPGLRNFKNQNAFCYTIKLFSL
jgi:hypothetical protein